VGEESDVHDDIVTKRKCLNIASQYGTVQVADVYIILIPIFICSLLSHYFPSMGMQTHTHHIILFLSFFDFYLVL